MSIFAGKFHPEPPIQLADQIKTDDAAWLKPGFEHWASGPVLWQWKSGPTPRRLFGLDNDAGLAILGDARLDNKAELKTMLGSFQDEDDIYFVLAAYKRWGEDAPAHLLGDFAYSIWDSRRQRLFCARDHFGVRPLYYHSTPDAFYFGSNTQSLSTKAPREINAKAVVEFLAGFAPALPNTAFHRIFRLPPGSSCNVDDTGVVSVRRYYELAPSAVSGRDPSEQFRAIFTEAVGCRLVGDAKVAAMLSGGLDSSSIVAVAAPMWRSLSGENLPTISRVYDETPEWNERSYIEQVGEGRPTTPVFLDSDEADPFLEVDKAITEQDGPFLAPALTLGRSVYRYAADHGLGVLLDGHGGDEVVSHGAGRLAELAMDMHWLELWRQCQALPEIYGEPRRVFIGALSNHRGARAILNSVHRLRRGLEPTLPASWARLKFVNPDFLRASKFDPASLPKVGLRGRREQASHLHIVNDDLQAYALESLHHNADALGVEVRYPFWDKRLVEFCVGVEGLHKLDGGWSRLILRRAMEGVLPPSVQWRRDKLDFTPHLVRGLLKHSRLVLDTVIEGNAGNVGDYVNLTELGNAYERVLALREEASGYDVHAIVRAVVLARWLVVTNDIITA